MPSNSHLLKLSKCSFGGMIVFSPQKSHLLKLSRCWLDLKIAFAGDYTYVHMIRHRSVYRLTYHDWCLMWNEVYWIPTFIFFNSEFWNRNSDFLIFQQRNLRTIFRPESLESKTELEFYFRWGLRNGNQKSEFPTKLLLLLLLPISLILSGLAGIVRVSTPAMATGPKLELQAAASMM